MFAGAGGLALTIGGGERRKEAPDQLDKLVGVIPDDAVPGVLDQPQGRVFAWDRGRDLRSGLGRGDGIPPARDDQDRAPDRCQVSPKVERAVLPV